MDSEASDEATVIERWRATLGPHADPAMLPSDTTYKPPWTTTSCGPPARTGFALLEPLHRGPDGVVWRAEQRSLARQVRVRLPATEAHCTAEQVLARLEHPNILPLYVRGETTAGAPFFVQPEPLAQPWERLLVEQPDDQLAHLSRLMRVCQGLSYAHEQGIFHRALQPARISIGDFGEVLVGGWEQALCPKPHGAAENACGSEESRPSAPPAASSSSSADAARQLDLRALGELLRRILNAGSSELVIDAQRDPVELWSLCAEVLAGDFTHCSSAAAFRDRIEAYLRHRESVQISDAAQRELELSGRDSNAATLLERARRYQGFAESLAGFEQARKLWPDNPHAIAGERSALEAYTKLAVRSGDLGLAQSLAAESADAALAAEVAAATEEHRRRRSQRRTWRRWLVALSSIGLCGLLLAVLQIGAKNGELEAINRGIRGRNDSLTVQNTQIAQHQQTIAAHLSTITGLSDRLRAQTAEVERASDRALERGELAAGCLETLSEQVLNDLVRRGDSPSNREARAILRFAQQAWETLHVAALPEARLTRASARALVQGARLRSALDGDHAAAEQSCRQAVVRLRGLWEAQPSPGLQDQIFDAYLALFEILSRSGDYRAFVQARGDLLAAGFRLEDEQAEVRALLPRLLALAGLRSLAQGDREAARQQVGQLQAELLAVQPAPSVAGVIEYGSSLAALALVCWQLGLRAEGLALLEEQNRLLATRSEPEASIAAIAGRLQLEMLHRGAGASELADQTRTAAESAWARLLAEPPADPYPLYALASTLLSWGDPLAYEVLEAALEQDREAASADPLGAAAERSLEGLLELLQVEEPAWQSEQRLAALTAAMLAAEPQSRAALEQQLRLVRRAGDGARSPDAWTTCRQQALVLARRLLALDTTHVAARSALCQCLLEAATGSDPAIRAGLLRECRLLAEQLVLDTGALSASQSLSECYGLEGQLAQLQGEPARAAQAFASALTPLAEAAERLPPADPSERASGAHFLTLLSQVDVLGFWQAGGLAQLQQRSRIRAARVYWLAERWSRALAACGQNGPAQVFARVSPLLERLRQAYPRDAAVLISAGRLALLAGRPEDAIGALERGQALLLRRAKEGDFADVELQGQLHDLSYWLGIAFEEDGQPAAAARQLQLELRQLKSELQARPDRSDTLPHLFRAQVVLARLELAAGRLESACRLAGQAAACLRQLARSQEVAQQCFALLRLLEPLSRTETAFVDGLDEELCALLTDAGGALRGVSELAKLEHLGRVGEVFANFGLLEWAQSCLQGCLQIAGAQIEINPNSDWIGTQHESAARLLYMMARSGSLPETDLDSLVSGAVRFTQAWLRRQPTSELAGDHSAQWLYLRALLRREQAALAEALADLDAAVILSPQPELLLQRGLCRALLGQRQAALADLHRAWAESSHPMAAIWLVALGGAPELLVALPAELPWAGWPARFLRGEISAAELLAAVEGDAAMRAARLCEAHCLVGLRCEEQADLPAAAEHYRAALATQAGDGDVAWCWARDRLRQLEESADE